MAFYEELKNKVVSDIIDTIQCNLTSFIQEKIKSDKYSQYNNIDEDFLPAPMISMDYLKKQYPTIVGYSYAENFNYKTIKDEEIIKYFCITEYLYPVFYFITYYYNQTHHYSNDQETKYIFVYNNGSILTISKRPNGHIININVVEQGIRMKYLLDNGKGIVTNKIIKFINRSYGGNVNNLQDYIIKENINYNDYCVLKGRSVIENMIIEMLKDQNAIPEYLRLSEIISDTEKLYTRLQETNNDIKLKLDKEREEFEEYKRSEIEKLKLDKEREEFEEYKRSEIEKLKLEKEQFLLSYESEVETIDRLKKEIQNEHSETLKSRKLQLEEDIRKEISNEYKERREREDKIFREEMDNELRRRIIKFEKESIGIEKEEEIKCLKLLYESIEENSRNLGKREENIETITFTVIEECSNSCYDLKNYIYKGKVYINHSSKLSVIAKYNKTKIEDYIRNYIKDYSDFYLEMITWIDSMSGRTNIICDELDKLTEEIVEYIED